MPLLLISGLYKSAASIGRSRGDRAWKLLTLKIGLSFVLFSIVLGLTIPLQIVRTSARPPADVAPRGLHLGSRGSPDFSLSAARLVPPRTLHSRSPEAHASLIRGDSGLEAIPLRHRQHGNLRGEEKIPQLLCVENRCFESAALVFNFLLQHVDGVDKLFRTRRAPGNVNVDGNELVNPLHDGVVIEYAAGRRARAHGNDPLGLRHLCVELLNHRTHLLSDAARRRSSNPPGAAKPGKPPRRIAPSQSSRRPPTSSQWRSTPGRN